MKKQKKNYWKRILTLVTLLGLLTVTGTVLAAESAGIGIPPDLTARWWQWAFSIPSSVHPLSFKATDPTGAGYCMVGQQGADWFLGGVFKEVDVTPASIKAQSDGNGEITVVEIQRACEIPIGKTILMPVLNGECSTAEELALGNDVPSDLLGKRRYLRSCAKTQADLITTTSDGLWAKFGPADSDGTPVEVKRVHTVIPFSVTFSPDNIISSNCPDGFLCTPDPNPSLAQADGYWVQVRPPKPGIYKLETYGEVQLFDFALHITYTLRVVGRVDQ